MTACRSALYVPGDRPDLCAKAVVSGADAVIVDLEDAVAYGVKADARESLRSWLSGLDPSSGLPELWVRVNPGVLGVADVTALPLDRLTGLCLAKVDTAADVRRLRSAAPDAVGLRLEPLVETASGLLNAAEIAREPGVVRLQLGEADLSADLGVGDRDSGLAWARGYVVAVSAAAGLDAPLAPVSGDFRDLDGFAASTRRFVDLGFFGRACIHPRQVEVANQVCTPDPADVAEARRLVELFDAQLAQGRGVCVDDAGQLVDEAVVRRARRLVELEVHAR